MAGVEGVGKNTYVDPLSYIESLFDNEDQYILPEGGAPIFEEPSLIDDDCPFDPDIVHGLIARALSESVPNHSMIALSVSPPLPGGSDYAFLIEWSHQLHRATFEQDDRDQIDLDTDGVPKSGGIRVSGDLKDRFFGPPRTEEQRWLVCLDENGNLTCVQADEMNNFSAVWDEETSLSDNEYHWEGHTLKPIV